MFLSRRTYVSHGKQDLRFTTNQPTDNPATMKLSLVNVLAIVASATLVAASPAAIPEELVPRFCVSDRSPTALLLRLGPYTSHSDESQLKEQITPCVLGLASLCFTFSRTEPEHAEGRTSARPVRAAHARTLAARRSRAVSALATLRSIKKIE